MKRKYIIFILITLALSSLGFAAHLPSGGFARTWENGKYTYDFQKVIGCDFVTNERTISPPSRIFQINGVPENIMGLYEVYGLKQGSYSKILLSNCFFHCDEIFPTITSGSTIITFSNDVLDHEKIDKDSIRFDSAYYDPVIIGLNDHLRPDGTPVYESRYGDNEDMSCIEVFHLEFNSGIPTTTTTMTSSVTSTTVRTPTTINTGTPTTIGTTPTTLGGTPITIPIPPVQDITCMQGQLYNPANKLCVANDNTLVFIIIILIIIGVVAWIAVTKL